ncbi:MAG TPA: gamma-glutamyltransferase [Thermomicrobiales bacterium]|nr:gamma-glutamyltransferase [Thermomicrobiales bacterium]
MGKRSIEQIDKSEVVSNQGAVGAMHPLAAEAGIEILKLGGNAVDAAVAIGFAIGVVEPMMSGLGAIAVFVGYDAAARKSYVIDGTAPLPAKIHPGLFTLLGEDQRSGVYLWRSTEGDANNTGYLSVAVPGTPACLCEAHERYGRLPLAQVMAPAIRLAIDGFELDWYIAYLMAMQNARLARFAETRRVFLRPDGSPRTPRAYHEAPDLLQQPDLARTLQRIADQGADGFYKGETAQRIATDMAANGGVLTEEDLADFRVRFFEGGMVSDYHGYQIIQSPVTNGAPTVIEALRILENDWIADYGHNSAYATHLIIEAERRAFVDRFRHLGDSDFAPVPTDGIVSAAYAAAQRATIDPTRATPHVEPGDPWAYQDESFDGASDGRIAVTANGHTTHFSVIDRDHNMVSCTSTLGAQFGSAVVAKDTGVLLNNGVMWFDPDPGSIVTVGPGKRIMTAGTPTLVLRDGEPFLAIGAPGGRRVISAIHQCLLNVLDYGMRPQAAISAPRVHCEGPAVEIDSRFSPEALAGLRRRGHDLEVRVENSAQSVFARPNAVMIDPETGLFYGGATPFGAATAMGV